MSLQPVQLDDNAFRRGHAAFLAQLEAETGVPFTGFDHRFFVEKELSFKLETQREGRAALALVKWHQWRHRPDKILAALRKAVKADAKGKLLSHQYGDRNGGYKALYIVEDADVPQLESHFFVLYQAINDDAAIGQTFDDLSEFLKDKSLGRTWEFLAYFLYLMRPERFFPIHSGAFQSATS